jgi:hypothetical protein
VKRERSAARLTGARLSILLEDGEGVPLALGEARVDAADPEATWIQPDVVFPWAVREGRA